MSQSKMIPTGWERLGQVGVSLGVHFFISFHRIQKTVRGNQLRPESARGVSARGALGSDQEVVQLGVGWGGLLGGGGAAGVVGGYKEEILTVSWV